MAGAGRALGSLALQFPFAGLPAHRAGAAKDLAGAQLLDLDLAAVLAQDHFGPWRKGMGFADRAIVGTRRADQQVKQPLGCFSGWGHEGDLLGFEPQQCRRTETASCSLGLNNDGAEGKARPQAGGLGVTAITSART